MERARLGKLISLLALLLVFTAALSGCYIDPDSTGGQHQPQGKWPSYTNIPTPTDAMTVVVTPTDDPGQQSWADGQVPGGVVTPTPTIGVVTNIPTETPTVTVSPNVYKNGSEGDAVRTIQNYLKQHGYYKGSVDGDFGDGTEAAVKAFQRANGLTADGIVGDATMAKLQSGRVATAKPTATPTKKATQPPKVDNTYLQSGNGGAKVTQMQTRLISLGYMHGSASGKFCAITEMAVNAFQTRNSLYADGIAGPETLTKLYGGTARNAGSAVGVIGVTLKTGSEGAAVRLLQTKLRAYGFYTGAVDGSFGSGTETAVKAFQRSNGITADGKAGNATLQKLFAGSVTSASQARATATNRPTATPTNAYIVVTNAPNDAYGNRVYITLQQGHMGTPVRNLQQALKNAGYYSGAVDGYYGEDTVTAVKRYQRDKGLVQDGKAGPATQRYLYEGAFPDRS